MEKFVYWLKNQPPLNYYIIGFTSIILGLLFILVFAVNKPETFVEEELTELYSDTSMSAEETFNDEAEEDISESSELIIELKGQVVYPGVYTLKEGARLGEAIIEAGGVTETADDRTINRALVLVDQMMVYIPAIGEEAFTNIDTGVNDETQKNKININNADQGELTQLNGIGDSRAQSIVHYREENGRFKTIEEIKNISGIGEKIFDSIKEDIVVD
ncbi:helix-hairpin-helix domain-containing protein [Marinilactibacillus sp. Marseille-P9653]|uniref:helix-hairpin-helix domain-containing protein n=1 Tax=Marinilactibacillus sp. Marseille-P9653 TaxID=2866583 RepID=UPI001CE3BF7D|nr:helix-hairpin-helix domain-containing protein [Marinilactibacillus sp. Marseille-P9653]